MATRQSELEKILGKMADELPDPDWVALVDDNGLIVSCIPESPVVGQDLIAGMTAASIIMAERVLDEIDGGQMRFTSIAGSKRQMLSVVLSRDRVLAIGIGPEVPAQATFASLTRWVPEILKVLSKSYVTS
ncbi:MAG: roadblock/LC7 domain-containing protein [Chloroflexi bacterium]|nr:roadblock/LC7 domain-containing protein [Chloroflexota bacterium]MDK1045420.1 roadblock/LC7 domain-containing protein [Anaerolineales bacterium]MCH8340898.1 roadblock/LC7 domain-containing protein [Chloroflexota bacterium]MCH8877159.1 roadblock/LC7 domain-containing protein [Chloroflexota bacterium]MCI0773160.1 roadblock/LC7 domain-containing protein [Chloroflexota bacterium]